jgi:pyruvate ferredoxin oxidoreductase gamma subunit
MVELRIHGRGGQGAVTSAEILALAAINEGKYALAFPSFGPERRGAPVLAFVRTDNIPIKIRAEVQEPDVVVVFDPRLIDIINVTAGLKDDGIAIVNSKRTPQEIKAKLGNKWQVATVDATSIARNVLGVPIVNTTMLGAIVKITNLVALDSLEEPLKHRFGDRASNNFRACKQAYEQVVSI